MGDADAIGHLALEALDGRPEDEALAVAHLFDRAEHVGADAGVLRGEVEERHVHDGISQPAYGRLTTAGSLQTAKSNASLLPLPGRLLFVLKISFTFWPA